MTSAQRMEKSLVVVLGTRPEIIRLSVLIPKLKNQLNTKVIFTGQNYTSNLSDIFFSDLNLPSPDYSYSLKSETLEDKIREIQSRVKTDLVELRPDGVLILGDTYTGLSAITCKSLGIPVFHMEAGNRCFSQEVPEERNRIVIDQNSRWLLPYTNISMQYLIDEGFSPADINVTGNPIYEVILAFKDQIENTDILARLNLTPARYILATIHRSEGVDNRQRLEGMLMGLSELAVVLGVKVVLSTHPRLRSKLDDTLRSTPGIVFVDALPFFDFIALEKYALLIATDSGTVQEEACILGIPCITLREVTERPETILCGSNVLAGYSPQAIVEKGSYMARIEPRSWNIPPEYLDDSVSDTVVDLVLQKI